MIIEPSPVLSHVSIAQPTRTQSQFHSQITESDIETYIRENTESSKYLHVLTLFTRFKFCTDIGLRGAVYLLFLGTFRE